jgi:MFS family permease
VSIEAKTARAATGAGIVLLTLCAGQFLMALDSSVMNVSIATVADDLHTSITGIQGAIVLYTLVMAMLMVTGGKIGSMIGRKRAFLIGLIIYCSGSLTTALAPNLGVLLLGWSILEGIGAALIMPAIVALVAGNFPAEGRPRAYGLVGAAGAIAIAVGPLIGGLATTYASWRLAVLDVNEQARMDGLRAALGLLALVAGVALFFTRRIPQRQPGAPAQAERAAQRPTTDRFFSRDRGAGTACDPAGAAGPGFPGSRRPPAGCSPDTARRTGSHGRPRRARTSAARP